MLTSVLYPLHSKMAKVEHSPTPISQAATKMTRLRVMLQGVPAFIMRVLVAALFYPAPVRQRGLGFAPPLRCAGRRCRCEYDYPRWGGHTAESIVTSTVLGASASMMGSELLQGPL